MTEHVDEVDQQPGEYPYMWALGNAIFLLLAIGAVLDPEPQVLWPKLTGSAALLICAIKQAPGIQLPRSTNVRLFTAVFLAADLLLIALIWTVR